MEYEEKLLVGYKWYDKQNIKTLFPFGYGLSYTKFTYSNLKIQQDKDDILCTFNVQNSGDCSGAETTQCYVAYKGATEEEPLKTLQGFDKTFLAPDEDSQIQISLNRRNFSYWNTDKKEWEVKPGSYEIMIGSSAEDIHLQSEINL